MSPSLKKLNRKQVLKRFMRLYSVWAFAFAILFISAVKLVISNKLNEPQLYAVISMPSLPLLGVFYSFRQFLKDGDEMYTRVFVSALLWGLAALMILLIPWAFMDVMSSNLPTFRPFYLANLFLLVFSSKLMHGHWKIGLFSKTKDYDPWREPKA